MAYGLPMLPTGHGLQSTPAFCTGRGYTLRITQNKARKCAPRARQALRGSEEAVFMTSQFDANENAQATYKWRG